MNKFVLTLALTGALCAPVGAADVSVSVSIGEPGFYGRIDIGGYPPPQLIYAQPVIIERAPRGRPPIYLRVPPGHAKHWAKHCREYNACGERVYFVRDDWYNREYVPRHQSRYEPEHGPQHPPARDERPGGRPDDDRRDDHDGDRGRGHGKGAPR